MSDQSSRVPTHQLVAFALPALPVAMILGPLNNILPAYYAQHTTASLSAIGAILLFTRISDAVLDQIVGYLSDITRGRLGRRKPWILAGALVLGFSGYALFTPPPDSGAGYFLSAVLSLYLGYSMVMVPHQAWSSELSRDYRERARITTYVGIALAIGGLAVFVVPLLPMFRTTEISAESLRFMAVFFLLALPATVAAATMIVPPGHVVSTQAPTLRTTLKAVAGNKPFRWFLAMMVAAAIALGMVNILLFLFMSQGLNLGTRIPHLFLAGMLAGLAALPLWLQIIRRIGKHKALVLGGALNLALLPALWFLQPGDFWGCLWWMVLLGLASGAGSVAPPAIMGDIIDYDILKTGCNRAGNYFAFIGFMQKSIGALGGALAFFVLDRVGFDAKAAVVDGSQRAQLLLAMTVGPGLLTVLSMWLMWHFPIDARRHRIIQRRLEARARRELGGAEEEGASVAAVPVTP